MSQFFDKAGIRSIALRNEPVKFEGLYFYPITVKQYELFLACEQALTIRLAMLPAVYAVKPYASAIFAMQINSMMRDSEGTEVVRYWTMFLQLMVMALRIPLNQAQYCLQMMVNPDDPSDLKALVVTQTTDIDGEVVARLSPTQMGQIRELIALLNGRELPDEADNAELVQAEMDIQEMNQAFELDVNIDDLKATIALNQRIRMKDLDDWSILEFDLIKQAIDREKHFMVYGIGESSGMVKFKNGNPVPSVFFNKKKDSSAVISAESFQRRVSGAIQSVDSLPNLPI